MEVALEGERVLIRNSRDTGGPGVAFDRVERAALVAVGGHALDG